ncbi:MAG: ribosome maturation factor RimM [Bacteroidota bacterium]
MLNRNDFFRIGNIKKLHGIKGEIILQSDYFLPDEFLEEELIFADIEGGLVPFFMEEIRLTDDHTAIIKLEDTGLPVNLLELTACDVYSEPGFEKFITNRKNHSGLNGYTVTDTLHGLLGKVKQYIDTPGNPLLEITGKDTSLLIPYQDEFIRKINHDEKTILVKIPKSLLNLYK